MKASLINMIRTMYCEKNLCMTGLGAGQAVLKQFISKLQKSVVGGEGGFVSCARADPAFYKTTDVLCTQD